MQNEGSELFLIVQCLDKKENLRTLYVFENNFETIKVKSVQEKDCYGYLKYQIYGFQADTVDEVIIKIKGFLEFDVIKIISPGSEDFESFSI